MSEKSKEGLFDFLLLMCLSASIAYVLALLFIKFCSSGGF